MRTFSSHLTDKEVWESYAKAASSLGQFVFSLCIAPWAGHNAHWVLRCLSPFWATMYAVPDSWIIPLLIQGDLPVPKLRVINQFRNLSHGSTGFRGFACRLQSARRLRTHLQSWPCVVGKLQERDILKFFLLVEIRNKSCTNAAVRNMCWFVDLKNCEHFRRV
jgi:hypothetical protein